MNYLELGMIFCKLRYVTLRHLTRYATLKTHMGSVANHIQMNVCKLQLFLENNGQIICVEAANKCMQKIRNDLSVVLRYIWVFQ